MLSMVIMRIMETFELDSSNSRMAKPKFWIKSRCYRCRSALYHDGELHHLVGKVLLKHLDDWKTIVEEIRRVRQFTVRPWSELVIEVDVGSDHCDWKISASLLVSFMTEWTRPSPLAHCHWRQRHCLTNLCLVSFLCKTSTTTTVSLHKQRSRLLYFRIFS